MNIDRLLVPVGTIPAIEAPAPYFVGGIASLTLVVLAIIYRRLVAECFDPGFLRPLSMAAVRCFLFVNLVAGFRALGTLIVVGLMMLPAALPVLPPLSAKSFPHPHLTG